MPERLPPELPPKSSGPPVSIPLEVKKSKSGCIIAAVVVGVLIIPAGIVIIGILSGLLFPAASKALSKAKIAEAQNSVFNLKNSISAYYTEYRKFPETEKDGGETFDSNGSVFAALLGENDSDLNPRRIAFFSGKAARPDGNGGWRSGVHLDGENSGLYDPWGKPYRIIVDSDHDKQVYDPSGTGTIAESILVFSAGPDGDFDTWEDNTISW